MSGEGRLVSTAAPQATIWVSIRSGLGRWQDGRVPLATGSAVTTDRRPTARGRALRALALWSLFASLVTGAAIVLRSPPTSSLDLPRSLEERARLLTVAWLDGDMAR